MDSPEPAPPPRTKEIPPMCFACGQMLAGDELKCPSCGAPLRGRRAGGRSGKLTVAAVLFIGLALLTAAQVAFAIAAPSQTTTTEGAFAQPTFPVSGTVRYENGTPAAQVAVSLDGGNATLAHTDSNGTYALARVPFGYHEVHFELANHTRVKAKVFVGRPESVDARMAPGSGSVMVQDDSYDLGRTTFYVAAAIYGALALLFVAAAVAAVRRTTYALVASAAWLSLLDVIPSAGITVVVSLILIVLVMRSKKEFR